MSAMVIEKMDGVSALEVAHSDTGEALLAAGFSRTPRGLRLR
jgi:ATP-dependent Lhr-like helicase